MSSRSLRLTSRRNSSAPTARRSPRHQRLRRSISILPRGSRETTSSPFTSGCRDRRVTTVMMATRRTRRRHHHDANPVTVRIVQIVRIVHRSATESNVPNARTFRTNRTFRTSPPRPRDGEPSIRPPDSVQSIQQDHARAHHAQRGSLRSRAAGIRAGAARTAEHRSEARRGRTQHWSS